jgi:hypothetical protein
MAEGRPRLVAVGDAPERAGGALPRAARRPRLVVPLLAGALVVCAIGWAFAGREASVLGRELEATRSALAAAELRLTTLESQRAQVHAQVEALAAEAAAFAGRLGELEALVASDHQAATPPQATGSESERTD